VVRHFSAELNYSPSDEDPLASCARCDHTKRGRKSSKYGDLNSDCALLNTKQTQLIFDSNWDTMNRKTNYGEVVDLAAVESGTPHCKSALPH
jgi:hypothetical protein